MKNGRGGGESHQHPDRSSRPAAGDSHCKRTTQAARGKSKPAQQWCVKTAHGVAAGAALCLTNARYRGQVTPSRRTARTEVRSVCRRVIREPDRLDVPPSGPTNEQNRRIRVHDLKDARVGHGEVGGHVARHRHTKRLQWASSDVSEHHRCHDRCCHWPHLAVRASFMTECACTRVADGTDGDTGSRHASSLAKTGQA